MKAKFTGIFLLLSYTGFSQCSIFESCSGADYNWGANCHGFALRYLQKGYNLSGLVCSDGGGPLPSQTHNEAIFDCAKKLGFMPNSSWPGYIQPAGEADHTLILYKNPAGEITHSAVRLGSSNTYLSKFESAGPVKLHARFALPPSYYSAGYSFTLHKLKPEYYTPNDAVATYWPNGISLSGCTSCSCKTSQGYFLVSASAPPGNGIGYQTWGPFNWSVSGASIPVNANTYIYVNKPGGGSVGVTATSTFTYRTNCSKQYSKFQMFFFPSCSGGGFFYSQSKMKVAFEQNRQSITLVLPETMTEYLKEQRIPEGQETRSINVQVFDLSGRVYENTFISVEEPYLELKEPLKKGIYIFKAAIDQKNSYSEKIAILD